MQNTASALRHYFCAINFRCQASELLAKNPILLLKIVINLQLALVRPPGDGYRQEPEWLQHCRDIVSSLSRPIRLAGIRCGFKQI
jgi:hypothetical protein